MCIYDHVLSVYIVKLNVFGLVFFRPDRLFSVTPYVCPALTHCVWSVDTVRLV